MEHRNNSKLALFLAVLAPGSSCISLGKIEEYGRIEVKLPAAIVGPAGIAICCTGRNGDCLQSMNKSIRSQCG